MLILAIDTSSDILGLSLIDSGQFKGEYNLSLKRKHSEKLLPLIKQFFELLEIEIKALDGIAVAIGPGSFTGLRIGITTAKMLSRIFSIPVKGISTLEIIAAGLDSKYILPLLDARRERVYYAFYENLNNRNNNSLVKIKKSASTEIRKLPEILKAYQNKEITIVGEKTAAVFEVLKANDFKIKTSAAENNFPRAAVLARLGQNYIRLGQEDDIYQLKPAYLKKTQAEINWEQKYGSGNSENKK